MAQKAWSRLYNWHMYLGVFLAIHIVIFSVTGAILLFKPGGPEAKSLPKTLQEQQPASANPADTVKNLKAPLTKKAKKNSRSIKPQQSLRAFQNAQDEIVDSKARILAVYPDDQQAWLWTFRVRKDGKGQLRGSEKRPYNLKTQSFVTPKKTLKQGFWQTLLVIHRELFLGSWGKIYLGFVGLLYVSLLISGWLLYGRFMKFKNFGQIRISQIFKLVDVHKFLGSITFAWSLIVALSGVFLAFNGLLIKIFQWQTLKSLSAKYADLSVNKSVGLPEVLKTVNKTQSDSFVQYISYPNTEFGIPGHFLVLTEQVTSYGQSLTQVLVVNAQNAHLTEVISLPFFLKLVLYSEPLHFADYGGLFFKLMWLAFSLLSLSMVVAGIYSFYLKRRKKRIKIDPKDRKLGKNASTYLGAYKCPSFLAFISGLAIFGSLFFSFLPWNFLRFLLPLVLAFVAYPWFKERLKK